MGKFYSVIEKCQPQLAPLQMSFCYFSCGLLLCAVRPSAVNAQQRIESIDVILRRFQHLFQRYLFFIHKPLLFTLRETYCGRFAAPRLPPLPGNEQQCMAQKPQLLPVGAASSEAASSVAAISNWLKERYRTQHKDQFTHRTPHSCGRAYHEGMCTD